MSAPRASHKRTLIIRIAPAAALLIAGCDTTAHSGVFAVIDTFVSFIGDFLRSALAAFLF